MSETNNGNNGRREVLRLETNVPVVAELLFDDGIPVKGRFGDQIMFTVATQAGERCLYVDPGIAQRFGELGIKRGIPFKIGKFQSKDGNKRGVEWKLRKIEPEEPIPGTHPEIGPPAVDQLPDQPKPTTKLDHALCTVISACHRAGEHAKGLGYQMPPFSSEDISKMAMTLMIEHRNGGGR